MYFRTLHCGIDFDLEYSILTIICFITQNLTGFFLVFTNKKCINMDDFDIKELEKAVSKARFVLSQKASALHDLIEDRLPNDYKDIMPYADATYKACNEWDLLNKQLIALKNKK
jgi:hypothetical protein